MQTKANDPHSVAFVLSIDQSTDGQSLELKAQLHHTTSMHEFISPQTIRDGREKPRHHAGEAEGGEHVLREANDNDNNFNGLSDPRPGPTGDNETQESVSFLKKSQRCNPFQNIIIEMIAAVFGVDS